MKKISIVLFVAIAITSSVNAQLGGLLDKAKTAATANGFDVSKLTSGIMDKLTPALSLTQPQQPKVTDAVTSFLTQKANILSLKSSDPAQYKQKQSGLFSGLKTKLAGILLQNQMNKFLGLKTSNPANVLSQLFN